MRFKLEQKLAFENIADAENSCVESWSVMPIVVAIEDDDEVEILQECFQEFDREDLDKLMYLLDAGHDLAYAIEHYEEVEESVTEAQFKFFGPEKQAWHWE